MDRQGRVVTKRIFDEVEHRGKTIRTSLHNKTFANLLRALTTSSEVDIGYIPIGYEHRPDKIATEFYNTPDFWWMLMLANNVVDPFEGFKVKQKIVIPKI